MASIDGKRLQFQAGGIFNCSLLAKDKETESLWYTIHAGVAVSGPYKGTLLKGIPTYHMTWEEWLHLHPDTDVLASPTNDPLHRDARYGHGADEKVGRSGLSLILVRETLTLPVDTRLPENTLILAATAGAESRVYPLTEVRREGGVVHDVLGGEPIAVWVGPWPESCTMGAYSRQVNGRALTFTYDESEGMFTDQQTGTKWTIEGKAVTGTLEGSSLEPLDFSFLRWHGWAYSHRKTQVYFSEQGRVEVNLGRYAPIIQALEGASYLVGIESKVIHLQRPNEAVDGITLWINGDRFHLWYFSSRVATKDFHYSRPHSVAVGRYALESAPEDSFKFTSKLPTRRRLDNEIPWSSLLNPGDVAGAQFLGDLAAIFGDPAREEEEEEGDKSLQVVIGEMADKGYRVETKLEYSTEGAARAESCELLRMALPVNALNAFWLMVDADHFVLYKFRDASSAEAYSSTISHTLCSGSFVLRSTPRDMYYTRIELGERPDEEVEWSMLLGDAPFRRAFASAVDA